MEVNRRGFLLGSAAAAVGLTTSGLAHGAGLPPPKRGAALKLSSQLGVIPGKGLEQKLEKMKQWGFDGVEPHGNIVGSEKRFAETVKTFGLKVSALCWGSAGGALVSELAQKRTKGQEAMRRAITAAGVLGSTGVIFVPAFNGQTKLGNKEVRKILVDTLPALGEHAVSVGTRILLEPLNRREAFFLRQLADGAAICRDCNHPGVALMGDFYHMGIEETSDLGAFLSAGDHLHHVHLASRKRVLPGQDDRRYLSGFRGLKLIGFQDYCSFECGVAGDREVEIPKAMAFLRAQWEQATI